MAQQEELGDLKLYRIPEPVTVAARSQKQVALLQRDNVRVAMVYRQRLYPTQTNVAGPAERVLLTRNRNVEGLGLPLPAGRLILFSEGGPRPILLGQGTVRDRAVGEEVEIPLGPATGVHTMLSVLATTKTSSDYELVVTNDRAEPVRFEGEVLSSGSTFRSRPRLGRRNGMPLWAVTVPANGRLTLRYSLSPPR